MKDKREVAFNYQSGWVILSFSSNSKVSWGSTEHHNLLLLPFPLFLISGLTAVSVLTKMEVLLGLGESQSLRKPNLKKKKSPENKSYSHEILKKPRLSWNQRWNYRVQRSWLINNKQLHSSTLNFCLWLYLLKHIVLILLFGLLLKIKNVLYSWFSIILCDGAFLFPVF